MSSCPCGFGETYEACCGRYHRGAAKPPTAEILMRARYSAFACGDEQFVAETWHPTTRPAGPLVDPALTWTGLFVTGRTGGGLLEQAGTVEFTARYRRADGSSGRVRENSGSCGSAGTGVISDRPDRPDPRSGCGDRQAACGVGRAPGRSDPQP